MTESRDNAAKEIPPNLTNQHDTNTTTDSTGGYANNDLMSASAESRNTIRRIASFLYLYFGSLISRYANIPECPINEKHSITVFTNTIHSQDDFRPTPHILMRSPAPRIARCQSHNMY